MRYIELPKISDRRKNPLDDFVFSSRVRISRNIEGLKFPLFITDHEKSSIEDQICGLMAGIPGAVIEKIEEMEKDRVMIYLANHVITREFITNGRVLVHDDGGDWVILLNEDDHLRIFGIDSGYNVKAVYGRLAEVLARFDNKVDFSYDEEFGYLTSSLLNVGTGLRVSCLANLYGIVATKKIESFIDTANKMGYSVVNIAADNGDNALFYVYNIYSLGVSEEELLAEYREFMEKTHELENASRTEFFSKPQELEIALEELFELNGRDRIDWNGMLYFVSLIDAMNRKYIDVGQPQKLRELIYTAHDDYMEYRSHVEKEFQDEARMGSLKEILTGIRYQASRKASY